jgi:hypothetical protein
MTVKWSSNSGLKQMGSSDTLVSITSTDVNKQVEYQGQFNR